MLYRFIGAADPRTKAILLLLYSWGERARERVRYVTLNKFRQYYHCPGIYYIIITI